MTIARHLSIHGRVQGVFYRDWAVETARELGLAGWVRNRRDGTVEAVVQGEEASVERFITLAKDGPVFCSVISAGRTAVMRARTLGGTRQMANK